MKLCEKDYLILHTLDFHAREPIVKLRKQINMSEEGMAYRIRRMQKAGIIDSYLIFPDPTKMGKMIYKLVVKYQSVTNKIEKEISDYLVNHKESQLVIKTEGSHDLIIMVWVRNEIEFGRFFTEFIKRYGGYFSLRDLLILIEGYSFRRDYLISNTIKEKEEIHYEGEPENICDKLDLKILHLFQHKNACATNVEIGNALKITSETVRYRVNGLIKKKVILYFRPRLNLPKMGIHCYNVMFTLKDLSIIPKMLDYARQNPNITHYSRYLGKYDVGYYLEVKNPEESGRILEEIRTLFGSVIINYDYVMVRKELKAAY